MFGSLYGGDISKDSYYNPFGVEFDRDGLATTFTPRLASLGNRTAHFGTTTDQFNTGFKGTSACSIRTGTGMRASTTAIQPHDYHLGLPNLNLLNQAPASLVPGCRRHTGG